MRKLFTLLSVLVAFCVLAPLSHATCTVTGEISRISVNNLNSNFFVRLSQPGSVSFLFSTADNGITAAAVTAQASHMRVTVTGSAAACAAVVGGASSGGSVIKLTTAP